MGFEFGGFLRSLEGFGKGGIARKKDAVELREESVEVWRMRRVSWIRLWQEKRH